MSNNETLKGFLKGMTDLIGTFKEASFETSNVKLKSNDDGTTINFKKIKPKSELPREAKGKAIEIPSIKDNENLTTDEEWEDDIEEITDKKSKKERKHKSLMEDEF